MKPKRRDFVDAQSAKTTSARSDEVLEDPTKTVALSRSCFASLRVSFIAHLETDLADIIEPIAKKKRFDGEDAVTLTRSCGVASLPRCCGKRLSL